MKKMLAGCCLLVWAAVSSGQQIAPPETLTKQDYLKKSKNQKTAAWLLLGAGTALVVTGSIIWTDAVQESNDLFAPYTTTRGTGVTAAGLVVAAGSIPLFIASGKNKRKAFHAAFKMQPVQQLQNFSLVNRPVPSVVVKINL